MQKRFEKVMITQNKTILAAMKQLDETAEKVLYVVDEDRHLLGSVTDGDIRRAILKGCTLEEKITLVMNQEPHYILEHEDIKRKSQEMGKHILLYSLPILNQNRQIIDVLFIKDLLGTKHKQYVNKQNKVFILAGGLGTRLEPFTKILPKPLIPIGEQPILEKIMDHFSYYGYTDFILSVLYKAEMIRLYFSDTDIQAKYKNIEFIKEETPLGTIGSLYLAKELLTESFFISNSDILIEENMEKIMHFHLSRDSILTVVGCVKNSQIPYGVLNMDDDGFLIDIHEKPKYRHTISTGVYVAKPELIDYIIPNQKQDFPELIDRLTANGEKISVFPILEEQWFDVGQWAEYQKTRKKFEINV